MLPWQQSFLHIFACLKLLHIYANFHLNLTNNSFIIAHLNIQPICAHTCDVIIFAEYAVSFCNWLTTLNLHIFGTKKDLVCFFTRDNKKTAENFISYAL